MYKRDVQRWIKHIDFFIVDEVALQLAFILAYFIRHYSLPYNSQIYRNLGLILAVIDIIALLLLNPMHNVLKRGIMDELLSTLQHCAIVFAAATVYLFATQYGDSYSRIAIFLTFIFHVIFSFLFRTMWKWIVRKYNLTSDRKSTMVVVLEPKSGAVILKRLLDYPLAKYQIIGIVFTEHCDKESLLGIPVVSDIEHAAEYICQEWVDEVYIDTSVRTKKVEQFIEACCQMAVPVHYHVTSLGLENVKQFAEKIGDTTVLTTSINYATPMQLFLKRTLDIIGGIIGSLIALIIIAIIGPKIKHVSPGPVLYSQERVGMNGKRFRIFKVRSMYLDADERKKELMAQNRVDGGMMFKMDFDPRVIGNEVLPDGTRKTGIGDFIRRTSLDEFPQFFNVLAGQMSLVGTRPPTVDEWEKYQFHHRARLSCKPGITGMWQVSGRSEITDFEEVVKLDTQYIMNWSPALDIKILLKTIVVMATGKGAM